MDAERKPSTVFSLLLLVYIGAGFTLLIAIEQFIAASVLGRETDTSAVRDALVDAGVAPGYASQAQSMVLALAIVSLVAAIAHVVLAVFIARRANWARIVLIILVAIGTLTDITWVVQGRWFSGLMLTIYDLAILALAFAPSTVRYCKRVSA